MKILITDPIGLDGIDFLKNKGYEVAISDGVATDADALIVRGRTKVTQEFILQTKNLKVIARSGTGVDNIDLTAAKERNIVVVNAPGANAQSVAEHTFALMLALARNLVPTVNTLKSGIWAKADFHGMELMGKTLAVLGHGHVGKRVAEFASASGMNVLVYTKGDSLSDILAAADIVSIHLPLTNETRGLIGASEFSVMKKTAFLVNTARGAIVDEAALVMALKNNTIAGAALDVFESEPLSPKSELLRLPNVILTPHVGADSPESENRASLMVAQDIHRVLQDQKPLHPVV